MTINTERLGPGSLTLGAGALSVAMQLTGCKLVPAETVETEEALTVVSGELLPESTTETYTYTLQGEFLQDLLDSGVVAWSYANKGTPQAFVWTPNDGGASMTGILKPVPLIVGGDEAGKRMLSAFTWRIVGDPVPEWAS